MADNQLLGITDSLFGVKPKTFESDFAAALPAFRGMSATDIGTAATYAGAKQAGRGLMQMAGIEDPEMASANRAKQFANELSQQGISMQSSQGMKALAQKLSQAGDFKAAQAASALAMNFEEKEAKTKLTQAQTVKALREPKDTLNERLLSSGKYTPASIAKYIESGSPSDLVLVKGAAGEGEAGPGPVGKTGAYRNAYGEIIPGSEMSKQRAGFQAGEKLLENLNVITKKDIKEAESIFDWTSGEGKKQIGGTIASKTVSAQAKINAAQLLKQIESLPPGSASNADMAAAKSSFPGYGNADNLERWVRDTKATLANSLARQAEQYGFNQRVQAKELDGGETPSTTGKKRIKFNEMK